jgi:hypothetical protein
MQLLWNVIYDPVAGVVVQCSSEQDTVVPHVL